MDRIYAKVRWKAQAPIHIIVSQSDIRFHSVKQVLEFSLMDGKKRSWKKIYY